MFRVKFSFFRVELTLFRVEFTLFRERFADCPLIARELRVEAEIVVEPGGVEEGLVQS